MILLRAENAKNRREAPCALPADLCEGLVRHAHGRALEQELFPDFNPNHAVRQLDLDLEAAGIAKRTFGGKADFHSLRTTHVNLGIELGFDVKTAQALARHENPNLTMNVYGRANAERLRSAVEKLGEAIDGAKASRKSRREAESGQLAVAVGAEKLSGPTDDEGDTVFEKWSGRQDLNLSEPSRTSPDTSEQKPGPCAPRTCEGEATDSVMYGQRLGHVRPTKESKGGQTGDPEFARLAALWPTLSADDRAAILALAASLRAKQSS